MDIKKNTHILWNNLASMASFHSIVSQKEVDYIMENFSGTVMCRGMLREVIFKPLNNGHYKVV